MTCQHVWDGEGRCALCRITYFSWANEETAALRQHLIAAMAALDIARHTIPAASLLEATRPLQEALARFLAAVKETQ